MEYRPLPGETDSRREEAHLRLAVLLSAFLASACSACATAARTIVTTVEPPAPELKGVLRLMGRHAQAHACPVTPDLALTSAHVLDLRPFDPSSGLYPYIWSDGEGRTGVAVPRQVARYMDLGGLRPEGKGWEITYPVASRAPQPGDRVWLVGYDFRSRRDAYAPRVLSTTVLRVVAGHLVLSDAGWPGSSGSCVLNALGEAVAVNAGATELGDGRRVGMAVGVWQ